MVNGKVRSYFGFAVKSGNLRGGLNTIGTLKKRVYLIAVCHTASENSKGEAKKFAMKFKCPLIEIAGATLGEYVGKENCKVAAVTDENLAKAILENI